MGRALNDSQHVVFVDRITTYLEELNFLVDEATYHEVMKEETRERLRVLYTPTSLYIRGRADRIAVHKVVRLCIMWEAKTNNGNYRNMAMEALPIVNHLKTGVRCLYLYWDVVDGFEGGFWVNELPPIDRILLPNRWDAGMVKYFGAEFDRWLPGVPVVPTGRNSGSGTPFIIIKRADRDVLFDWRQELITLTERLVRNEFKRLVVSNAP